MYFGSDLKLFLAGEPNFIKTLVNYDKDNITDRVLKRIGQYCRQVDFQPEIIGKVSLAAKSLCMWVRAMEVRGCLSSQNTMHRAVYSYGRIISQPIITH